MLKNAVYRYGGDEFVALIHGKGITKANIQNLCRFIQARFNDPWILEEGKVTCGISIGTACYGEEADTMKDLLSIADMAMYKEKRDFIKHLHHEEI